MRMGTNEMAVILALIAILVPASVTLVGFWFKQLSEKRLALERQQTERRLNQEQKEQDDRLRLDAAMRAADLFGPSSHEMAGVTSSAARSASGLLALTQLKHADLAVALLVDLWSPETEPAPHPEADARASIDVSTETAIQVIDAALESGESEPQVMAAALLCRKSPTLDICDPLHWPSSVNGAWIPQLPVVAKLLTVDALIHMALASTHTKNALRELAVRLYSISVADPEPRVKGCIGTLMKAIMPAVGKLGYTDFMQASGHNLINLKQMEAVAAEASHHQDGYFEKLVQDRREKLEQWSQQCTPLSTSLGMLATACVAVRNIPANSHDTN
jgi:hypothetical protein